MGVFKEPDTIYLIDEDSEEIILAVREQGMWTCKLCDENEDNRVRMLHHVRFSHILVR